MGTTAGASARPAAPPPPRARCVGHAGGTLDRVIDEPVERRWGSTRRPRGQYRARAPAPRVRGGARDGGGWCWRWGGRVPWTKPRWAVPFRCVLPTTLATTLATTLPTTLATTLPHHAGGQHASRGSATKPWASGHGRAAGRQGVRRRRRRWRWRPGAP